MIWGGTEALPEKWLESCLTNQSFFSVQIEVTSKKQKKRSSLKLSRFFCPDGGDLQRKKKLLSNWAAFSVQIVVTSKKKGLHSNWATFSVQKKKKGLHSPWDSFSIQRSEYFTKQACLNDMQLPKILTQYFPKNMKLPEILRQNLPKYMKLPKIFPEIWTPYTNWPPSHLLRLWKYEQFYWFFSKNKNEIKIMPALAISMEKHTYTSKI